MPISSSVYDSSPPGKDLTFTFSTTQNGVPLSYTDVLFQFRLYDARTDLTGDVVEDTDQIITTADSGAFPDYFILDEEEQVVAVTIPWAVINNYEEGFSGNTHGALEAIMPAGSTQSANAGPNASSSASILFFGTDDGRYITNSKGYTGEDITRIKNSLSTSLNKTWSGTKDKINRQGDPVVIGPGECLGSDGLIYDTTDHDELPCYCFAPYQACHADAPGGVVTTMWGPFAVMPAPWIIPSDPDMNLCGEKTFMVYVMLYGGTHSPCEHGVGTISSTRYLIQSYLGSQANLSSRLDIPGWNEDPGLRQPYYQTTGTLETDAQACMPIPPQGGCGCHIEARIIPIAVPIEVRPMDNGGSAPPVLITLDLDGESRQGSVCYADSYCNCSCRVFQPLPLADEIVWNVTGPGCGTAGQPFTPAANCGGTLCGLGGDTTGGLFPYQFSQVLFKNWPNNTAPPSNINGVLQHNSIFGSDGGPLDPPHSKYTHYTPNMPTMPWAESDYYECGSKYHIWLRFESPAIIG